MSKGTRDNEGGGRHGRGEGGGATEVGRDATTVSSRLLLPASEPRSSRRGNIFLTRGTGGAGCQIQGGSPAPRVHQDERFSYVVLRRGPRPVHTAGVVLSPEPYFEDEPQEPLHPAVQKLPKRNTATARTVLRQSDFAAARGGSTAAKQAVPSGSTASNEAPGASGARGRENLDAAGAVKTTRHPVMAATAVQQGSGARGHFEDVLLPDPVVPGDQGRTQSGAEPARVGGVEDIKSLEWTSGEEEDGDGGEEGAVEDGGGGEGAEEEWGVAEEDGEGSTLWEMAVERVEEVGSDVGGEEGTEELDEEGYNTWEDFWTAEVRLAFPLQTPTSFLRFST